MPRRPHHTRRARTFTHLEPLEPRINLSAFLSHFPSQPDEQPGIDYSIPKYANQDDLNPFQPYDAPTAHTSAPVSPAPSPSPTPNPIPTFTAQNSELTTENFSTAPITLSHSAIGNFSRLTLTGTPDNDSILISQSNHTLLISANGTTTQLPATFTEIALNGLDGDDAITVDSSVTLTILIYPGAGTNTVANLSPAKNYIVSLGTGQDTLTGTAATDFWADPTDTITNGTPATTHRIANFFQPFSKDPANSNYVPLNLNGQNLPDPTDSGNTVRLAASLWGDGPAATDVIQGQLGDCYFLADLQSLAAQDPDQLQHLAVDLGDGTYAVQFKRSGKFTYVRVDADLSFNFAHPSAGGAIWAAIFEKAYALFRTSTPAYSSLNWGWVGSAFNDLGIANASFNTASPNIFSTLSSALTNDKAVTAISNGSIPAGIPIIPSHAYSILATTIDNGTPYLTLRNPWGTDGAGSDSNPSDALLTLTLAQFQAAFSAGAQQT